MNSRPSIAAASLPPTSISSSVGGAASRRCSGGVAANIAAACASSSAFPSTLVPVSVALPTVGAALPPGALGHLRGAADALVAGLALPAAAEVAAAALARLVRRGVPETFVDSSLDTSIARRYAIAAASSRCL